MTIDEMCILLKPILEDINMEEEYRGIEAALRAAEQMRDDLRYFWDAQGLTPPVILISYLQTM